MLTNVLRDGGQQMLEPVITNYLVFFWKQSQYTQSSRQIHSVQFSQMVLTELQYLVYAAHGLQNPRETHSTLFTVSSFQSFHDHVSL